MSATNSRNVCAKGVRLVLFSFSAWTLRVVFLGLDSLSDFTLEGVVNEALRLIIFS